MAHGDGPLPRTLERLNAVLAASWLLIANPGDAIWRPSKERPRFLDAPLSAGLPKVISIADPRSLARTHDAVFWAEDAWARRASDEWGFRWQGCDPEIVARVNSRRFQTRLEQELGVAPAGLQLTTNLDELSEAVNSLDNDAGWILKAEFGTAGRESRRGKGSFTREIAAWADKRFARDLVIIFEPRFDPIAEAGVQFQIHPSRQIEFIGVVGSITHPNGSFLASRILSKEEKFLWRDAITVATQAAHRIAEAGYVGPLGIDAMRYRDKRGHERLRPVQDVNARYTMGRLALGLKNHPRLMNEHHGRFIPASFWGGGDRETVEGGE